MLKVSCDIFLDFNVIKVCIQFKHQCGLILNVLYVLIIKLIYFVLTTYYRTSSYAYFNCYRFKEVLNYIHSNETV